ncbi:MAG: response regulator [Geobacteraceae bacterium]|nr:response regulator [Geobacteraceae bacterium]
MSLVGNLADLGLGEILQIVSLSRKSGVLTLHSRGRQGIVVFRFGQVVRATSSSIRYFLGEDLVKRKVVDEECLNKALQVQQASAYKERLGPILINRFNIPVEQIEAVVREQIERVVYSFFSWDEGSFEFELQDDIETIDDSKVDPLQFMLQQGLNPQFLAMEGSRIIDEKRHRGDTLEDEHLDLVSSSIQEVSEPVRQEPLSDQAHLGSNEIVIVEDDQTVRDFLAELLTGLGSAVFTFSKSEDALITIDTLFRAGDRPSVLLDLIMPRMDGSGVLGGLELLELIHSNFPELPVLVMSDYRNSDAERRIRETGAEFILKPRKSELADAKITGDFASRIKLSIEKIISGVSEENPLIDVNLGDELRLELGDTGDHASSTVVPSTGISLLRGMLEELGDPSLGGGVILLLLRFASEFVGRAVIFLVKENHVVGIGQFGIECGGMAADMVIRNMKIPKDEESIFSEVFRTNATTKMAPAKCHWNDYLFENIGGAPAEVFLGPLVSEGKVFAVLYGDNPDSSSLGDTDSLEIFLSQAGVAMEKALLTERLMKRDQEVL